MRGLEISQALASCSFVSDAESDSNILECLSKAPPLNILEVVPIHHSIHPVVPAILHRHAWTLRHLVLELMDVPDFSDATTPIHFPILKTLEISVGQYEEDGLQVRCAPLGVLLARVDARSLTSPKLWFPDGGSGDRWKSQHS